MPTDMWLYNYAIKLHNPPIQKLNFVEYVDGPERFGRLKPDKNKTKTPKETSHSCFWPVLIFAPVVVKNIDSFEIIFHGIPDYLDFLKQNLNFLNEIFSFLKNKLVDFFNFFFTFIIFLLYFSLLLLFSVKTDKIKRKIEITKLYNVSTVAIRTSFMMVDDFFNGPLFCSISSVN